MAIGDSSENLRRRLDKAGDESFSIDAVFETVNTLKKAREKKVKEDQKYQLEAAKAKALARDAGFDFDYDPNTGGITPPRPFSKPVAEPSRFRMDPDGGATYEESFDETGAPTDLDEVSKANLLGYQENLKAKAQAPIREAERTAKLEDAKSLATHKAGLLKESAPKPLTEGQRVVLAGKAKVERLVSQIEEIMDGGNYSKTDAAAPKWITTSRKAINKRLGLDTERFDNSERLRDTFDQLRATIPFAKGGKALSKVEAETLFKLLEYGPDTSDESMKYNLQEFRNEFRTLGLLAGADQDITEDELSNLASDDLASGDLADARRRFMEENELEE